MSEGGVGHGLASLHGERVWQQSSEPFAICQGDIGDNLKGERCSSSTEKEQNAQRSILVASTVK